MTNTRALERFRVITSVRGRLVDMPWIRDTPEPLEIIDLDIEDDVCRPSADRRCRRRPRSGRPVRHLASAVVVLAVAGIGNPVNAALSIAHASADQAAGALDRPLIDCGEVIAWRVNPCMYQCPPHLSACRDAKDIVVEWRPIDWNVIVVG